MKKVFFILIAIVINISSFGQSKSSIKNGGYLSIDEFKTQMPFYGDYFQCIKRTTSDIKAWGGNDYKFESNNDLITKDILKKDIWGISKSDTLYLNGYPINGLIGYAKVEIQGKYCFLHPAYPANKKIQKELGLDNPQGINMFGALGGAIQGAKMAVKRFPLIYNIVSGEKLVLSKPNLLKLLEKHGEISTKYLSEANPEDENVLLKYLVMLNESEK